MSKEQSISKAKLFIIFEVEMYPVLRETKRSKSFILLSKLVL